MIDAINKVLEPALETWWGRAIVVVLVLVALFHFYQPPQDNSTHHPAQCQTVVWDQATGKTVVVNYQREGGCK